jgi:hypothetical protein
MMVGYVEGELTAAGDRVRAHFTFICSIISMPRFVLLKIRFLQSGKFAQFAKESITFLAVDGFICTFRL